MRKRRSITVAALTILSMTMSVPVFAVCSDIPPPFCGGTLTFGPVFFACSTDGNNCCEYGLEQDYCNGVATGTSGPVYNTYTNSACQGNYCQGFPF